VCSAFVPTSALTSLFSAERFRGVLGTDWGTPNSVVMCKLEYCNVAGAVVDEPTRDPAGSVREPRHLFARCEEDVVPRGRVLAVAETDPLEAAHPSALTVPCVVVPSQFRGALVGIVGAGQDPPSVGGDTGQLPKQAATLLLAGKKAEVIPEQQDGVEALVDTDGAIERSEPHVAEPPLPRNLGSQRGDIDPDYLVSAALEV
jgi:hypothetical protein